jgi:hypothetical protein
MFDWLKRRKKNPEPNHPMEPTVPVRRAPPAVTTPIPVVTPVQPAESDPLSNSYTDDATLIASSYAIQARQVGTSGNTGELNENAVGLNGSNNGLNGNNSANQPSKTSDDAREYLEKVRAKEDALAMRFATGQINRKQFEELYANYQQEIRMIEQFLTDKGSSDSQDWRNQVTDGQSILIRRKHAAQMISFSIYDLRNGLPLITKGDFGVDPALFVPMLFTYQSATREIFGGEVRLTQIEGGKWLCFIPGNLTSTIALYNNEPSQQQIKNLEQSHKVFEDANANQLNREVVDPDALVLPHEFFLKATP